MTGQKFVGIYEPFGSNLSCAAVSDTKMVYIYKTCSRGA